MEQIRLEVLFQDETVWLTQRGLAELFQKDMSTINRHIKNVCEEGELEPDSTIAFFAIVQNEGNRAVTREVAHYNLHKKEFRHRVETDWYINIEEM